MIEIILISLFLSVFLNIFLKFFGIPTIVGYIFTGVIVSYIFGLHKMHDNNELKVIAEFGIVFLMFTIGLEFSIKHLIKMKKEVFLFGFLQVILSSILFFFIGYKGFGFPIETSIIIGAALSLSSTAIVLKILNENRDISKEYGQKALGILLFQDIAVIPILVLIEIFSKSDVALHIILGKTLAGTILLIVLLWFLGKYILEGFLYTVSKIDSNEIFIGSILLIVIGLSYLAHILGLSYSLGALIAGLLIAETNYKHQVEADLIPFRDILLGIFFITVGMQLNFGIILDNILLIFSLLSFLILAKIIIIYGILSFFIKKATALKTALSLFQIGEFGIVILELSSSKGLIDSSIGQILIVIIIISMIITPFVIKNLTNLTDLLVKEKIFEKSDISTKLYPKIVLIGYGRLGKIISTLIEKKGYDYMIIEKDPNIYKEAKKEGKPIIYGNASQKHILKSINIEEASSIVISVGNNKKLYLTCETVAKLAKKSNIIVKVNKYEEKEMLSSLNILNIIVETEETARSMFKYIKA